MVSILTGAISSLPVLRPRTFSSSTGLNMHQRCWASKAVATIQQKSYPSWGKNKNKKTHKLVKGHPIEGWDPGFSMSLSQNASMKRSAPPSFTQLKAPEWLCNASRILRDLTPGYLLLQSHAIYSPLPLCAFQPFWISCFFTSLILPQGLCTSCLCRLACSLLCLTSFCSDLTLKETGLPWPQSLSIILFSIPLTTSAAIWFLLLVVYYLSPIIFKFLVSRKLSCS